MLKVNVMKDGYNDVLTVT